MKQLIAILFLVLSAFTISAQDNIPELYSVEVYPIIGARGWGVGETWESGIDMGVGVNVYSNSSAGELDFKISARTSVVEFYPGNGIDLYKGLHVQGGLGIANNVAGHHLLSGGLVFGYLKNFYTPKASDVLTFGFDVNATLPLSDKWGVIASGSFLSSTGTLIEGGRSGVPSFGGFVGVTYKIQ